MQPSNQAAAIVVSDDGATAQRIPSMAPVVPGFRLVQDVDPVQPDERLPSRSSVGPQFDPGALFEQPASEQTAAVDTEVGFSEKQMDGDAQPSGGSALGGAASAPAPAASDVAPPSAAPAADTVNWSEVPVLGSGDAGSLLQQSTDVQTVRNQRRSPVSFDPRVRGFKSGQIYTQGDGTWWTPVRTDLDTMLSKIDPGLLDQVTVVPGPYGLRYGPGLAFLHIQTAQTPRYEQGPESHARTGITVHPNGGQLFGRATLYGGAENWGFLINHGNRAGNDYRAGNGNDIPASYHNANYWSQFGVDLDSDTHLEMRYGHLDQTDTQYAGQFFDIDALVTDSLSATLLVEQDFQRMKFEGWTNHTEYYGDTDNPGKRPFMNAMDPNQQAFNVINRVEFALAQSLGLAPADVRFDGLSRGDLESSGARAVITYGEIDGIQWSVGSDIRYLQQRIDENFTITNTALGTPALDPIHTNQPKSALIDAGLFSELDLPLTERWNVKVGSRVDTVHTDVRAPLRDNSSLPAISNQFDQHDTLYAFYITSDRSITEHADLQLGMGHAQRPPTLTERYADGVFLGIIQNGFSRVIGNPALAPERSWQVDMTLDLQRTNWRGRVSGYHAWVFDYVTYEGNLIQSPEGARLLVATNTNLATLAGFEVYSEFDVLRRLTAFGSMSYIEGRDRQIDAFLPGMYPLESTVGLRIVSDRENPRRGLEFGARIVNDEDRIGRIRVRGLPDAPPIAVEQETPGFTTLFLRGYWNVTDDFNLVAGIDNLGDRTYLEHLNLRLPADAAAGIPELRVLSPGFSPYFSAEWTF